MRDIVTDIIRYESGEMTFHESIEFFGGLIRVGLISGLQGTHQRTAAALIEGGFLTAEGDLTEAVEAVPTKRGV